VKPPDGRKSRVRRRCSGESSFDRAKIMNQK
jgi:hypothetical protein